MRHGGAAAQTNTQRSILQVVSYHGAPGELLSNPVGHDFLSKGMENLIPRSV